MCRMCMEREKIASGNTMTDTEKRLRELEAVGLVERTGEIRDGKPVWKMTAWARQLDTENPEVLDSLVKRGPADA